MRWLSVFFALVFLASYAFAGHLEARISEESGQRVESDDVILECFDGLADDCNPTMWYYLTVEDACSDVKDNYTNNVTDTDGGDVIVQHTLGCEAEGAKHLCLWVEKNGDPSHNAFGTSAQLNVYCLPACEITRPTTLEPFIGGLSDSTNIEFNVTEQNLKSYSMRAFDSDTGNELCSSENNSPQGNSFSEECSWSNAEPAFYDVEVTVKDQFEQQSACINSESIIVEGNTPPRFFDFKVVLFGFNEPIDNAFNLNDLFYDAQNDELEVEITDASDCTRLVGNVKMIEDVTKDELDYIDIGKVNVNPPENEEYSCAVQVRATETSTPERYVTDGSFQITIKRAGEMNVLVKKATDNESLYVDADEPENPLRVESSPGQNVELDVKVVNFLSGLLTDPIDIYFILDASGTFRHEFVAVKNSLELINTNLNNAYRYAECMPDCVRYGVVIFAGKWVPDGQDNMTDRGDRWVSRARTMLGSFNDVKDMIDKVKTSAPWKEPWFEYSYYSILDEDIGWRPNAKKMVVLITDAPSNGDHAPLEWDCGPPYKFLGCDPNFFPEGLYSVVQTAKDNDIIFSAIYPNDPELCEKKIFYNGEWICPGSLQAEELCRQRGGICIPYGDDSDFQPIFGGLYEEIAELLEHDKDTFELSLRSDLYEEEGELFDDGWFCDLSNVYCTQNNQTTIEDLPRGDSATVRWQFHVPAEGEPGYKEGDTQKTFGYFGEPLLMDINDSFFFQIKFAGAPTEAVIDISENLVEGAKVEFDGAAPSGPSTCRDDSTPSYEWNLKDSGGGGIQIDNDRSSKASKTFGDNIDGLTISLEITCDDGSTDLAEQGFSIANAVPEPIITPTRRIEITPGTRVSLFGEPNDPGTNDGPFQYRWKFGDEPWTDWSQSREATHSWNNFGTYRVLLEVQDKNTGIGGAEKYIYVTSLLNVFILEMKTTDQECPSPEAFDSFDPKTIFSLDETINACFKVTNNTNNDLGEVHLEAVFLEAYSRKGLQWFTPEKFGLSANQSLVFTWEIQNDAAGSFLLEGLVEKHSQENFVQDNSANGFVTVTGSIRNPLSVPEIHPIMIVLVALTVIFLAGRKKT